MPQVLRFHTNQSTIYFWPSLFPIYFPWLFISHLFPKGTKKHFFCTSVYINTEQSRFLQASSWETGELTTFKAKKITSQKFRCSQYSFGSYLLMASSQCNWAHPIIHLFCSYAQVRTVTLCYLLALLALWPSDNPMIVDVPLLAWRTTKHVGGSISIRKSLPVFCHASRRQVVVSVTIRGTTICLTEHASLFTFNYQTGLEDRTTLVFCLGEQQYK